MRRVILGAGIALTLMAALSFAIVEDGIILPFGSATLKSLHFRGHPNLGMYSPTDGSFYLGGSSGGITCDDDSCDFVGRGFVWSGNGAAGQVPSSSTRYLSPFTTTLGATEANATFIAPADCYARSLFVQTGSAQPATGTLQIQAVDQGSAIDIQLLISANAGAAVYSATGTGTVAAGDVMRISALNSANSSSAQILAWGLLCE